jgi:elongator complex protein 3
LIHPQLPILSIGVEGFENLESAFAGQVGQFVFVEVMSIAQAFAAGAPVEQVVAFVYIGGGKADAFPGLDALAQPFGVEKLPVGEREAAFGFEQVFRFCEHSEAYRRGGDVVEHGKGADEVERAGIQAPVGGQVDFDKIDREIGDGAVGGLHKRGTEIKPGVRAAESAPGEDVGEFAVAAAKVEDALVAAQSVQDASHAGLDALAGGREVRAKGLVELAIEVDELLCGFGLHVGIILLTGKTMEIAEKQKIWRERKRLTDEKLSLARQILAEIHAGEDVLKAMRAHPAADGHLLGKSALVAAYQRMVESGEMQPNRALLERIRMKPVRTLSGVTTVTVLTKPYPCPGKCIFCPTDVRMPKSYLPDEPGAMRGLEHKFDPYAQVASRIAQLQAVGHPTDKIELLILGGTWSAYRRDYQEWFIKRCFDAMNAALIPNPSPEGGRELFPSPTGRGREGVETCLPGELDAAQALNETAAHRNVGLVIETRPDEITPKELAWLRYLGVTKVQMGAQSLDDRILEMNQRGHDVESTRQAVALLRAAGFKIVLHWMPNLHGATPQSDREDFARLWEGFCPDEIKIYPNQLLANAELYEVWQRGEYQPYSTEELVDLIADIKPTVPRYCRINRVIRDIPSTNVVEGNKRTSLRQDVHAEMARRGTKCQCVRCREIRKVSVEAPALTLNDLTYQAGLAEEHFISFDTADDGLAGFVRLSLPAGDAAPLSPPKSGELQPDLGGGWKGGFPDLDGAALIREVHVYGQSLPVGAEMGGAAQHIGLGTRLLEEAERVARLRGFKRMAVIAAVGTRKYYLDRGFERGALYLVKNL